MVCVLPAAQLPIGTLTLVGVLLALGLTLTGTGANNCLRHSLTGLPVGGYFAARVEAWRDGWTVVGAQTGIPDVDPLEIHFVAGMPDGMRLVVSRGRQGYAGTQVNWTHRGNGYVVTVLDEPTNVCPQPILVPMLAW